MDKNEATNNAIKAIESRIALLSSCSCRLQQSINGLRADRLEDDLAERMCYVINEIENLYRSMNLQDLAFVAVDLRSTD